MSDKFSWTREQIAEALGVTPARVSQIAKTLRVKPAWRHGEFGYTAFQLNRMKERDTKPGPKRNGTKK